VRRADAPPLGSCRGATEGAIAAYALETPPALRATSPGRGGSTCSRRIDSPARPRIFRPVRVTGVEGGKPPGSSIRICRAPGLPSDNNRLGVRRARRPRLSVRPRSRRPQARPAVGLRQDRPGRSRPGAARRRRRAGLDRRHQGRDRRGRDPGQGRLGPDGLPRDDGRPGEDPAPGGARRAARRARCARACAGHGRPRHRRHRYPVREPLSVRGDRRERRQLTRSASRTSTSAARP
jgi:hypothetical protein